MYILYIHIYAQLYFYLALFCVDVILYFISQSHNEVKNAFILVKKDVILALI